MNLYLHSKWLFLECFQTVFYHKQSRTLFCLQEQGVTQSILVLDIARTVSLSEPAGTFQICFSYFISFNMKSFS